MAAVNDSLTISGTQVGRGSHARRDNTWPTAGITLSRYVLRRRLGHGGMGQVWAAWDGELAREVAIKVVRLRDARSASVHAERLAREARALARLSDPHVVQVYDVGSYDTEDIDGSRIHGVFVVMELVRGLTLGEWLSASSRSLEDVVRLFVAAARGLATAHAAGLVHRDVKPTNIFVGDDGRVRIGDFGLARGVAPAPDDPTPSAILLDASTPVSEETLAGSLTDTGTVVGTPLYMAPEQHGGLPVDARGDQYALCVALYEGLYRVRPFVGGLEAIARAKWRRDFAKPMFDEVPAAVHDVMWRGLEPHAAERWPTMTEFADALEHAIQPQARRRWLLGTLAGIATVAALAAAPPAGPDERCDPIGASTWTEPRRLGVAHHGSLADVVDAYVAEIDARQAELCRGSVDEHLAELQCLRRAAGEIDGVISVLEEPRRTPDVSRLLEGLPDVAACRSATQAGPEIAERDRRIVDAEMRRLARGDVLWRSERTHEALALGESVLLAIDAGRAPAAPLRGRALLLVGKAYDGLDSDAAAERALSDAYFEGTSRGDAETAFDASSLLAMALAENREHERAATWLRHAEVELAKLPAQPMFAARLANARAAQLMLSGDLEGAVAEFRAGLEQCSLAGCKSGVSLTTNLAAVLWRLGQRGEAQRLRQSVLATLVDRYGVDSPASVQVRLELVHGLIQTGDIDGADALLRVTEGLVDRWLEPMHRYRALANDQRADILLRRGDPAGAVEVLEKSFAIVEQMFGEDDLRRVTKLNDLGFAYFASGRGDEALATLGKARALTERVDPTSFEHGALLISLGHVKGELGDYEGALADLHEAKRTLEPLLGPEHPDLLQCDRNEATVLRNAGRVAEASEIEARIAARAPAPAQAAN
jgi:tetratricopeptide (TPR) repeat protein